MRLGTSAGDYQRLDPTMTPMIDVCFQIIIFFIANMRIILPEGDFNVTMPLVTPGAGRGAIAGGGADQEETPAAPVLPAIMIHLSADKNGELAGIIMGKRSIGTFEELRRQVRNFCGTDRGPANAAASPEVEINFDYNLKYQYVMRAVTAISGYTAEDKRTVVRMIEKIRFGTLQKKK